MFQVLNFTLKLGFSILFTHRILTIIVALSLTFLAACGPEKDYQGEWNVQHNPDAKVEITFKKEKEDRFYMTVVEFNRGQVVDKKTYLAVFRDDGIYAFWGGDDYEHIARPLYEDSFDYLNMRLTR